MYRICVKKEKIKRTSENVFYQKEKKNAVEDE